MTAGNVYWITGFSNSGKTTIGSALYYAIKRELDNVVILDGDLLKEITSGSEMAGYDKGDRFIRAKRYSQLAKLLSEQGIVVIVCAIAMFDEIREWNRKNIKGYIEIFLDPPEEILKKRDKKGLYHINDGKDKPKSPDVVFRNDGNESIDDIVGKILEISPRTREDYDRDKDYWNSFYANNNISISNPSDFAVFIERRLSANSQVLELGCGNGRDSLYFLSKGHKVTGVDGSDVAISKLNKKTLNNNNAFFVCDNFVKTKTLFQMTYDCIYSRFTLHAITEDQETELFNNIKNALGTTGFFCVEARSIHDEIYGKGEEIAHNTFFYNNHFRRFIDIDEFEQKLTNMGFEIILLEESQGFSKTENSDPFLIRCIAKAKAI